MKKNTIILFLSLMLAMTSIIGVYAKEYPNSLFEQDEENSFLNAMARYHFYNERAKWFIKKTNDMNYFNLEKFSKNPLVNLSELRKLFADNDEDVEGVCKILLFDMFKVYVSIAHQTEFESFKNKQSGVLDKLKQYIGDNKTKIDTFKNTVKTISNSSDLANMVLTDCFNMLHSLVALTKNDYSPVSKSIRKFFRYFHNVYNKNNDGRGITTELIIKKGNRSNVMANAYIFAVFAEFLDFLERLSNFVNFNDEQETFLLFMENNSLEFIMNLITCMDKSLYNQSNISPFTEKFIKYIQTIDGDSILNIIEDLKKIYQLDTAQNIICYSSMFSIKIHALLKTNALSAIFADLGKEILDENTSHTMYSLYADLLAGLKPDSIVSFHYGYITGNQLQKHLFSTMMLHRFTYFATLYFQSLAKTSVNNDDIISGIQMIADKYKINENSIELDSSKIGTLSSIGDIAVATVSVPFIGLARWIVGKAHTFDSSYISIQDYFSNTAGTDSIHDVFGKYGELVVDLVSYEKFMMDCMSARLIFDDISSDNISNDSRNESLKLLHISAKHFHEVNNIINYNISNIEQSHRIELGTGIGLTTNTMMVKLKENISRKDYLIMMMKAVSLNPYADSEYLRKLLKGKLKLFDDMKNYYGDKNANQKLSMNEIVWLLYGKEKGIIFGYGADNSQSEGELRPFENISRLHAIAFLGRIYRSEFKSIAGNDYKIDDYGLNENTLSYIKKVLDPVFEANEISDSDVLYNSHLEFTWNVGTCVNTGLIKGSKQADGKYKLELDRNLSIQESQIIAIRLFDHINIIKAIYLPLHSFQKTFESSLFTMKISENNDYKDYSGELTSFPGALNQTTNNFEITELKNERKRSLNKSTSSKDIVLYTNKQSRLVIRTYVPEKYKNYIEFGWSALTGKLLNFSTYVNSSGFLETAIDYIPPAVLNETILPLTVYANLINGVSAYKDFSVRIKPRQDFISQDLGTNSNYPHAQFSASYQQETNAFKFSYLVNEFTQKIIILYSFDFINWKTAHEADIQPNKSYTALFSDEAVKNHNKIYFSVEIQNTSDNLNKTLETYPLSYIPQKEYAEKSTELPLAPVLQNDKFEYIINSIRLDWQKIIDSHNNDNVNIYEVQYDTSPEFDQAIQKNIGNPTTGASQYEVLHYTLTGLEDDQTYYIRMRGINNLGAGNWSEVIRVSINMPDYPDLMDFREPKNNATNVSKYPILKWRAHDADYDKLDFKIIMGTSSDDLNITLRHFDDSEHEGEDIFDFSTEYYKALLPGTTYYWQVWVNEKGFYHGDYVKSSIWSFTTVNTKPDLIITDVSPLDPIQPDQLIRFKIKVKNQGAEPTEYQCFKADYIKNGNKSPFKYVRGCLYDFIQPQETKEVDVSVRFWGSTIKYEDVLYDNVLIGGESKIRFILDTNDLEDDSNNTFEYTINYENAGAPEIQYFNLREYNDMYPDHPSDYFVRKDHKLHIIIKAIDDIQVKKGIVQYRLHSYDSWVTLIEQNNDSDIFSFPYENLYGHITPADFYEWKIPEDIQNTKDAQIRVILYDDQDEKTERISEPFSIISDKIISEIKLSKLTYMLGENLPFDIHLQSDNTILSAQIFLKYATGSKIIFTDSNANGLPENIHHEYTIPNDSNLASKNCFISMRIRDNVGSNIIMESERFQIQFDDELPEPFKAAIDVYQNDFNFPDNAQYKVQNKKISFVKIDDNNIAHIIVTNQYSYFQDTANDTKEDNFINEINKMYITCDSGQVSSPIKICDKSYDILDLSLLNNVPYVLLKNPDTEKIFYSYLNLGKFMAPLPILNTNVPELQQSPMLMDEKDSSYDVSKFALCNGYLWELVVSGNYVSRYSFNDGHIGDMDIVTFKNNVGGDISSEYIKPVVDGNIIYYIDRSKNMLIVLNTSSLNIYGYDLPFEPQINSSFGSKTALAAKDGKIFIFGNGRVYSLENNSIVEKNSITYSLNGKDYDATKVWNSIYSVKSIVSDENIYLIIYQNNSNSVPLQSNYDILLFNKTTYQFTKNIARSPDYNGKLLHGEYAAPNNYDLLYVGNNKVIIVSVNQIEFDNALFRYESEMKMLNIETGDITFVGNLPFKGKNNIGLTTNNGKIYAFVDDMADNKFKSYLINLPDMDIQTRQYENISFVKRNNKLYTLWSYGNPYNGKWNESNKEIEYYLNRKNQWMQIAPTQSNVVNISNEYLGREVSIHGDYLSTKSLIGELNTNLQLEKIVYQSENFLYRPFQFKSYGNQYLSALTNHLQDENTIEIHLLNNDTQTIKNLKVYTDTPTVSAYENEIIMVGYGMDQYYGKQLITKINLKTGQTSNLSFGKSYDPISNLNLIDINRNKYVAVGWNTLLAVGDFSEDISAPQIKITSQGGTFQNYDYYTLEWTCSDNLNELIKFEIYEEINNQSRLIKSIDDTSARSLDYCFSKSDTNVTLSVHAYDADNNVSVDKIIFTPRKIAIITAFDINTSQINKGEEVTFSWSSDNSKDDTLYTIFIQQGSNARILKEVMGKNTTSVLMNQKAGTYKFQIQSDNDKAVCFCSKQLIITEEQITFDNNLFYPKDNLLVSNEKMVHFKWSVKEDLDDPLLYKLYVKTDAATTFEQIASTTDNQYTEIFSSQTLMFTWKVLCEYKQELFESSPIEVVFDELISPDIKSILLTGDNIFTPAIKIQFDPVDSINEYVLFRKVNSGDFINIANLQQSSYNDTDISYGNNYTYAISSKKGEILGSRGISRSTPPVRINSVESIKILNTNGDLLSSNTNIVDFKIIPENGFKYFKICLSETPYDEIFYSITEDLSVKLEDLKYNQTYYLKIIPVDFEGKQYSNISSKLFFTTGFDSRPISGVPVLEIVENNVNQIVLKWDTIVNADEYLVFRKDSNSDYQLIGKTFNTNYNDTTDIQPGKTYTYVIQPENAYSKGEESLPVNVTIQRLIAAGDLNNDKLIDLKDAILGFQTLISIKQMIVFVDSDVNHDYKIGMIEILYILNTLSDIKSNNISLDHGLVAYYPFNGNANDESGNGNDGEVLGATLTEDRFGNPNKAYFFDGDGDYIHLSPIDNIAINNGSLALWFQLSNGFNKGDSTINLFSKDISSIDVDSVELSFEQNTGKLFFNYGDSNEGLGIKSDRDSWDKKWFFVVITWGDSGLQMYIDGIKQAETKISKSPVGAYTTHIGTHQGVQWFYKGIIDSIRIYNRVLSDNEINSLFSIGINNSQDDDIPYIYKAKQLPSEDGWAVINYEDYESKGATINNEVLHIKDSQTDTGSAIHYLKEWDVKPDCNNIAEFDVKIVSNSGGNNAIYIGISNGTNNMTYDLLTNKIVSYYKNAQGQRVEGKIVNIDTTDYNTYKLSIVKGIARLFINNDLLIEQTAGIGNYNSQGVEFGAGSSSGTGEAYFKEIRIYRNCEDNSINDGLVAYYPFNGNANDESGNGNDGVVNGATLTIDRYGNNDSAYLFDGDNDYIEIIDSDLLGVIHEMSICAWVKNDYIISKYDTSQRKLSFALSTKEQNKISFNVYTNMDNYYAFDTKYSTNIVENDYYFIVSTWKNNELKIFVNGEQQELINYSTGNFSDIQKNNIPILIGAIEYINGSRSFSKGCIDEIRFYNRALSEHEIINLYQKD